MPEMREKRYLGAAVVDANDNMWVLGGYEVYSESDLSKNTEVFEYYSPPRKGRWRRGSPLPSALRDSGLESHCARPFGLHLSGASESYSPFTALWHGLNHSGDPSSPGLVG